MKRLFVALLLVALIGSTTTGIAFATPDAPPDLPMIVYGTVFLKNGGATAPAGAGVPIRALAGGSVVGQATTEGDGSYVLLVAASQPVPAEATVSFTVNDKTTGVTHPFISGGVPINQDFTVDVSEGGDVPDEPPAHHEPPPPDPGKLTVDGPRMQQGLAGAGPTGPVIFEMQDGLDQYQADFADEALDRPAGEGRDVTLDTGEVIITFDPDTFRGDNLLAGTDLTSLPQDYWIRILITKLTGDEIDGLGANPPGQGLPGTTVRMGNAVYHVQFLLVVGAETFPINHLNPPVEITVTFANGALSPDLVGLYILDEAASDWELLGGRVDGEQRTVSFHCDHVGVFGVFETIKVFSDLVGHWAAADIQTMYARGIVNGMTQTTFAPNLPVTRAQFTSMLVRVLQLRSLPTATLPFTDVTPNDWFYGELAAAYQAGLVSGVEATAFGPDVLLTREQAVTMIARGLAHLGRDISVTTADRSALAAYPDSGDVHAWAVDAMAYAVTREIIRGRDGLLAPGGTATRAEVAVMLNRLF